VSAELVERASDVTLQRRSGSGPSAKFLAAAKKRLVIGVPQISFSQLEFFAF